MSRDLSGQEEKSRTMYRVEDFVKVIRDGNVTTNEEDLTERVKRGIPVKDE